MQKKKPLFTSIFFHYATHSYTLDFKKKYYIILGTKYLFYMFSINLLLQHFFNQNVLLQKFVLVSGIQKRIFLEKHFNPLVKLMQRKKKSQKLI